jgi:hypothetical protein
MTLLRWSVVMVLGFAGGVAPSSLAAPPTAVAPPPQHLAPQVEEPTALLEARVEIGPAVVFIYDEAGRVIATE